MQTHLLTSPAREGFGQLRVPFRAEKCERSDERTGTDAGNYIVSGALVAATETDQRSSAKRTASATAGQDQSPHDAVRG
jgi:hypothetical protein